MSETPAKPEQSEERFLVTVSPHIRTRADVPRVMWTVVVALLPALFAACYVFGLPAVKIVTIAVVTAVVTEGVIRKLLRKTATVADGSAVVTGLLVAFVMPSNAPWFVPLVASAFAIGVVKLAFGGLGCNIWNPALAGRAFVVACFAGLTIGGWQGTPAQPDADPPVPARSANWVAVTKGQKFAPGGHTRVDAMTGASALSARKDSLRSANTEAADAAHRKGGLSAAEKAALRETLGTTPRQTVEKVQAANHTPLLDLFLGTQVGCVGETSALAILVGGIVLLVTGTIRWYVPVSFIGTVALLGWLLPVGAWSYAPAREALGRGWVWCGSDPLFEMLSGGVMLGAIFMATDMVTGPLSRTGKLIFGCGCGVLTVIIRKYGGYPEGVCYSILLMNTATPLIDALTKPRVYGKKK